MKTNAGVAILGLALALAAGPSKVVAQEPPQGRLASATTLACTFPVVTVGSWTKGAAEATVKPAKLVIKFDKIDRDEGTARVTGDFGPSEIIVRQSGGTLHFLQSFRDGPLYVTTVFSQETHDGRMRATHSRHESTAVRLPGFTSSPEQYYGDCELGS